MAIEIERKFLVADDAWRTRAHAVVPMEQGYLDGQGVPGQGGPRASVRVRIEGDEAYLNIKSREPGHTRQEFEYPLPAGDADALLGLCMGARVRKQRHLLRHGLHLWEIDVFEGDNAGLVVAEVELGAADEAFARPEWLGAEVTDCPRYYNIALAARPFSQWSEDERRGPAA